MKKIEIGRDYVPQRIMRSDPTGRYHKIYEEKPLTWKDYFRFAFFAVFYGLLIYFVYNVTETDIEELKMKHQQMRR